MNYELAKELKDAGFPFKAPFKEQEDLYFRGVKNAIVVIENCVFGWPTLSELIEACGNRFASLKLGTKRIDETKISNWWYAYSGTDIDANGFEADGSTPEEAVSRLWLVLNKEKYENYTV